MCDGTMEVLLRTEATKAEAVIVHPFGVVVVLSSPMVSTRLYVSAVCVCNKLNYK